MFASSCVKKGKLSVSKQATGTRQQLKLIFLFRNKFKKKQTSKQASFCVYWQVRGVIPLKSKPDHNVRKIGILNTERRTVNNLTKD